MKKEWSTWLKRNNTWLFLAAYVTLHFTHLEFHPFIPLKTGLAALITLLANTSVDKDEKPLTANLIALAAATSVFLLDETLVPELRNHVRMRHLFPVVAAVAFLVIRRKSLRVVWNFFLAMNVLFLSVNLAYSTTRRLEFRTERNPSNRLYDTLTVQLAGNVPVTMVLADGYPSDSALAVRFGIRMRLDSLLEGYSYQRLQARYTSTPLSVSNLLFGATFPNDDAFFHIRGRQTEVGLVRQALDSSSFRHSPAGRDALWLSFILDEGFNRSLDLPWWKREHFRALFDNLYLRHVDDRCRLDANVRRYNEEVLAEYRKAMEDPGKKGRFVFLHLLTFHSFCGTMRQEVDYADSLVQETIRLTPKSRKVVVFSDHGYREPGMDGREMRSGMMMTSPDP